MLGAAEVTPLGRERIAGTVHVDGTARAQIATGTGLVEDVLDAIEAAGRDPVLINTSFNARGEPIVNTPVRTRWPPPRRSVSTSWSSGTCSSTGSEIGCPALRHVRRCSTSSLDREPL